ncbi:MAG: RNA-dependent RNA polymerase [Fushun phenuivirus 1]|nr:MAG: RNA-dependent RNA polymerase [Fushun phenuivirus 1]
MEPLPKLCDDSGGSRQMFFFPAPKVIDTVLLLPLPKFSFDVDEESIRLLFDFEDDISGYTSISRNYVVNDSFYRMKTFIHDFVFSVWASNTDVSLLKFFPNGPSELTNLTPDICFINQGVLNIIEFATCRAPHKRAMEESFGLKEIKYKSAIEHLALTYPNKSLFNKVNLFIVVVGLRSVVTNMIINDQSCRELVARMTLACRVYDALRQKDLISPEIEHDTLKEAKLSHWLNKIKPCAMVLGDEYEESNYLQCLRPSDKLNVSKAVRHVTREAAKKANEEMKNYSQPPQSEELSSYMSEITLKAPNGFNESMKSILNIPFLTMKSTSPSLDIQSELRPTLFLSDSKDPTFLTWKEAVSYYHDNHLEKPEEPFQYLTGKMTEDELEAELLNVQEEENVTDKTEYHRCNVNLPQSVWTELALKGINGKSFAKDPYITVERAEKKKPFSLETNTEDLEDFINGDHEELFTRRFNTFSAADNNIIRLIQTGHEMHDNPNVSTMYLDALKKIALSPIFSFCSLVSDIASELSISMKQHCKKGQFILKKLKDYPLFLLIKTTKSSSHVFYSILWKKDDAESIDSSIFKKVFSTGSVCWTSFSSLNQSKLVNWVLMKSRIISLIPYWYEFYGVDPFKIEKDEKDESLFKEARKMILLCLLIALVDKAEVEESLSTIRFISMEAFVAYPLRPNPIKMVSKLPTIIRSRLTVYIINKILTYVDYVAGRNIKSEIDDESHLVDQDELNNMPRTLAWTGLINPITKYPLENPGQLINMMYLGYVKNKHEQSEISADSDMLIKILTLENKFTKDVEATIGRKNRDLGSNTYHDYNIDLIKEACDFCSRKISQGSPVSFVIGNGDELTTILTSTKVEDVFMTLKASSNFDSEYYTYSDYITKARNNPNLINHNENYNSVHAYYRSKVIEKSVKYVSDDTLFLSDILPICFAELQDNNCLHICIFKKQQHGGLREIYVLNFPERVIQYVLELAGRILCQHFQGETMTHPKNKKRVPEEHSRASHQLAKTGTTISTYTSADAAKWSQNHYPHKFAIMLINLFPKKYHGFFWNSLKLWKNKKIKLSDNFLNFMNTHNGSNFYDPLVQEVYDGFKGYKSTNLIGKGQSYVVTKTGMMQGILHYVSSAFHSVINRYCEKVMKFLIIGALPESKALVTTMQSSDDSGALVTINVSNSEFSEKKRVVLTALLASHYVKTNIGEEVGIRNSIKTTFHCNRVYEFNSKFFFGNKHYEPEIKNLFASLLISERESIVERQEEAYTLLSSYVTSGGTFYSAEFVQMSQAFLNYRCLGFNVSSKSSLLTCCLHAMPEVSLGFFLMDNPVAPGLPGIMYNVWLSSFNDNVSCYYSDCLMNMLRKTEGSMESTRGGILTRNTTMQYGAKVKLEALKRRLGLPEDWVEYTDENPDLFFRPCYNKSEYLYKVSIKLSQRGVSSSLCTGVPITSIIASSVYILNKKVFSVGVHTDVETSLEEYKGDKKFKASLFGIIMAALRTKTNKLQEEERSVIFPYASDYFDYKAKIDTVRDIYPQKKLSEKRRIVSNLIIYDRDIKTSIKLKDLLSQVWFPRLPIQHKYTYDIAKRAFQDLKIKVKWLDEKFPISLSQSPFDHAYQMMNWLERFEEKPRNLCLLGAPVNSKRGRSTIVMAIIQNFSKFHVLSLTDKPEVETHSSQDVFLFLAGALTFPGVELQRVSMVSTIIENYKGKFDHNKIKSRRNTLSTMKECLKSDPNLQSIISEIEHNKRGHIGYWSKRQRFNSSIKLYEGLGVWHGLISGIKTQIVVSTEKGKTYMDSIEVQRFEPHERSDFIKSLNSWVLESHITYKMVPDRQPDLNLAVGWFSDRLNYSRLGCRIIKKESLAFALGMKGDVKFSLSIPTLEELKGRDSASIRITYQEENKKKTVLSLSLSSADWLGAVRYTKLFTSSLQDCWVGNKPLSIEEAHALLFNTLIGKSAKNQFIQVLKNSFVSNGMQLGLDSTCDRVTSVGLIKEEDDDDENDIYADIDTDEALRMLQMMGVEDDEPILIEDHTPDQYSSILGDMVIDTLEELLGDSEDIMPLYEKVVNLHNLFVDYITHVLSEVRLSQINNIIKTGKFKIQEAIIIPLLELLFPEKTFIQVHRLVDDVDMNAFDFQGLTTD